VVTIGSYEEACGEALPVGANAHVAGARLYALDGIFPMKAHPEGDCPIEKKLMQDRTADSAAVAVEGGFDGCAMVAKEADAVEWVGLVAVESVDKIETKGGESFEAIGKDTLAAGFVDGRLHGIGHLNGEALEGAGNGAGEPGWTCTGDEDVGLFCEGAKVHRDSVLWKYDAERYASGWC